MPKRDYFDDPEAPTPNSLVSAVTAFVQDERGQVLLIQRSDNDLWALPGGAQELGESLPAAAVREVEEETGIQVEVTGMVGTYSDPRHVIAYDDGEVRQELAICFRARPVSGELTTSAESKIARWVAESELTGLSIHPSMRLRLEHGFHRAGTLPYIG